MTAMLDDREAMAGVLAATELVVTSSECLDELRRLAPAADILVEDGRLDRDDVELVRRLLTEGPTPARPA